MSIVPLLKVTLYGLIEEKEQVFAELQDLGLLHLVPLSEAHGDAAAGPTPQARNALKFLLATRPRRRQVHDAGRFDAKVVEQRALEVQSHIRDLEDRRDFLRRRIQDLEPWGDFRLFQEETPEGLQLWFYILHHYQLDRIPKDDLIWEVVHRDNRFSYVVVLSVDEPQGMPVERTHTGKVPLSQLRRDLEDTEVELEDLQAERVSLSRWCDLFASSINRLEDRASLDDVLGRTYDEPPLFALQGWVAQPEAGRVRKFAAAQHLALVIEPPSAGEQPPTLMDNPEPVAGGQNLVSFYMTPGYTTWDPSLIVFFSFALFFAMIMSDAGYALVLGAIVALYWRRMGRSNTGKRLRNLFLALTGASLLWGMLTGSYFGTAPPAGTPLAALHLLDINDTATMMRLSVVIGVLHIAMANLADAWRRRHSFGALAPLGWVVLLAGGMVLWLASDGTGPTVLKQTGPWLMTVGGAAVLFFSGEQGGVFRRLLSGLLALTRITSAFGDVLSYLRLFALGIASASLALAFNDLAGNIAAQSPAFGKLLALLILLLGHGLNFGLAVMSGFVHGLRLNFIEFFNWSVSEEGYPFRAFARKEGTEWNR